MDAKNEKPLSHADIWDDSILLETWNEALAEYKKYHSIFARGAVEELVDEAIAAQAGNSDLVTEEDGPMDTAAGDRENTDPPSDERNTGKSPFSGPELIEPSPLAPPMIPPQAVLGSIRDEGLKRLLMSWYYAGYYTGFYEGQGQQQQQAALSAQSAQHPQQPQKTPSRKDGVADPQLN